MIPGSANPLLLASAAAAGGYQVSRSLRFNSSDSGFCARTPGTASNRKTWTWAAWVKRSYLNSSGATYQQLFTAGSSNSVRDVFFFDTDTDDTLAFFSNGSGFGAGTLLFRTNAVFRDVSAWYHIVLAVDTTQATAANRIRLYVNGVEQTFSTANYPSQNSDGLINSVIGHGIGRDQGQANQYFDGYLAECYLIDGQQLTPSSFTEVNATTGQLLPLAYSGTFGTNGFWLKFSDNSAATAATLGNDYSGNSNNWTPNNLSVTAGAGNDSLVDTPTSYGTDTSGVGGEVRGNYCTINPLIGTTNCTISNGNLDVSFSTAWRTTAGTFGLTSGKWYWENTMNNTQGQFGVVKNGFNQSNYMGSNSLSVGYMFDGNFWQNGSPSVTVAAFTTGDVIGVAFDADNGTLTLYKNGVSQGQLATGLTSGPYFPGFTGTASANHSINFGQRPFAYQTPGTNRPAATFLALCDTNLGAPLVAKPNTLMDVKLYTGNGSTQTITGLAFNPDFVWIKCRTASVYHALFDVVRGVSKRLGSNETSAEQDQAPSGLSAFDSSGFTVVDGATGGNGVNGSPGGAYAGSAAQYVAWAWDAGTSTVSNTAGSITSQVRANVSAGFSVVTYTGNGTGGATFGHGLGVKPGFSICKKRTGSLDGWYILHSSLGATKYVALNSTSAATTYSGLWNNTEPTSTLFSLGVDFGSNQGGVNYISYQFAPVVGYSSFGSYTGNGSADGPFVFLGFRPRWLMYKVYSGDTGHWFIHDTSRDPYNEAKYFLRANLSTEETTSIFYPLDILSNGFKIRSNNGNINGSGYSFLYAAFAENPFQYSRAR